MRRIHWKYPLMIAFIVGISLLPRERALAQFSPGELSRAHQELEGTTNCTKCHEVGKEISGAKCLVCHQEIGGGLENRTGYHGLRASQPCVQCHKEHLGRNARTMRFTEKEFDHSTSGFDLNGKHRDLPCAQCHASANIRDKVVQGKLAEYPHTTYLGLDRSCHSCHKDVHAGKFKQECGSCHSASGWTQVSSFEHSSTRFPLEGKHLQVPCAKCHTSIGDRQGKGQAKFATAAFTDCAPCHASPHKFRMQGRECRACHHPGGWKDALAVSFDHGLTAYGLSGRHRTLRCEQCHRAAGREEFSKSFFLPFGECTNCHADKHSGEFTEAYHNDCARCHTVEGYSPSTFSAVRHDAGKFPLTGAHRALLCRLCHLHKTTGAWTFRFPAQGCSSCHSDVHRGQFQAIMAGGSCEKCHTTERWDLATYDHSGTGFALLGKHRSTACAACHKGEAEGGTAQFRKVSAECESCHPDKHGGQFVADGKTECNNCHAPEGWKSLIFGHDTQSSFVLQGAHRKVPCGSCHHLERIGSEEIVRYKPLPKQCESCHQKKVDGS